MPSWSIYYSDGVVWWVNRGESADEWVQYADYGVQVVVENRPPLLGERSWVGVDDRVLYTGQEEYDPFGWGVKYGSQLADGLYWQVWVQAAYDGHPPPGQEGHPALRLDSGH